jgi:retron-type reverse transcriptase
MSRLPITKSQDSGSSGVNGMEVSELKDYLKLHWTEIRDKLLMGKYNP